jgi:predicted glycosyltransferase
LRDILDDPDTVRSEWANDGNEEAIRRYYHAVWVYGDPHVYDMVAEYSFPVDIGCKVRYTGYLDHAVRAGAGPNGDKRPNSCEDFLAPLDLPPGKLMLCMVGGGEDGRQLAQAFAQAEIPDGAIGVVVTGPFMPSDAKAELRGIEGARSRLRVLEFLPGAERLLGCADRVVAMGGYNTTGEVLSFEKPALIVPRVEPRLEQWIRAERLSTLGLLHVLHPSDLSPKAIGEWLVKELPPLQAARSVIDLGGLTRLPRLLSELLSPTAHPHEVSLHGLGEFSEGGAWCVIH